MIFPHVSWCFDKVQNTPNRTQDIPTVLNIPTQIFHDIPHSTQDILQET